VIVHAQSSVIQLTSTSNDEKHTPHIRIHILRPCLTSTLKHLLSPRSRLVRKNLASGGVSSNACVKGLNQPQNAASKTTQETSTSKDESSLGSETIDHREQHDVPSQHGEAATGSALGRGDTGSLKEKDVGQSDAQLYSKDGNLEGEQMRAPGEGDVADAVKSGGGGGHAGEESITKNLDAKAEAHKEELHARGQRTGAEIEEEEKEDWTGKKADVGEALAGRGNKVVLAPEE